MKKQLILITVLLCIISVANAQTTYVPDDNFEQALINLGYDSGPLDNHVLTASINTLTNLDVSGKSIADLTGIEDFTALTTLDCRHNQLISLDVTQNTALTELDFGKNNLTSIDVSQNIALTSLKFKLNNLTSIDLSQNTALTTLAFWRNRITSLDLSQNTALTYLFCPNNRITSLDLSQNIALTYLDCSDNNLTSLDLSQNTALTTLICIENRIKDINVSQNTALTELNCFQNHILSLDVSQNIALKEFYCDNNYLKSLDVSQNTALIRLECYSNRLTSLNVKNGNNTNLLRFWAYNNPNLIRIEVDDAAWSTAHWTSIDEASSFSDEIVYQNNIDKTLKDLNWTTSEVSSSGLTKEEVFNFVNAYIKADKGETIKIDEQKKIEVVNFLNQIENGKSDALAILKEATTDVKLKQMMVNAEKELYDAGIRKNSTWLSYEEFKILTKKEYPKATEGQIKAAYEYFLEQIKRGSGIKN